MRHMWVKIDAFMVIMFLIPVEIYRKGISPLIKPRCKYYPSCSEYAVSALKIHGFMKGIILSFWRIMRCNPWSDGGVNHVPDKGEWVAKEWIPPEDWVGHDIEEGMGKTK